MVTISFDKFLEMSDLKLIDLISGMFSGTGYAINEKNEGEYDQVKTELKATWPEDDKYGPCIEDIFAEMLRRGMTIVVTDPEGKDHDVTFSSFENGLTALVEQAPDAFKDYLSGNADSCTDLNFIDCIIFGEPVYG